MVKNKLKELLDKYDKCTNLECDGMTRIIHYVLHREKIDHQIYYGLIRLNGKEMNPHFWIKVGDLFVDYRARMWLDKELYKDVAHGVFDISETKVEYIGNKTDMEILPKFLFEILIDGF